MKTRKPQYSILDPGQRLVQVEVLRVGDKPIRFRCGERRAQEVLETCRNGWWQGYRVEGAMVEEVE